MLGWKILKDGEYRLEFPTLSHDEEELILATEERFKEHSRTQDARTRGESAEMIKGLLMGAADGLGIYIDKDQREYLAKMALMHIYGFAFIDELLKDDRIEEISVIGPMKPAYAFIRNIGWKRVNACFCDEKAITEATNKMARHIGRHITLQNPRLDAMLPDGSRLHASLSPVSSGEITIRRFRDKPYSPRELLENGTIQADALAYLSLIMQCDCSLIIGGNTASGKTTTLNALFSFVPSDERVLITEETPEINIPHPHQMRLVANREMGITLKDLVYDSLRMRPDRMIVGEIRNAEEAEALFEVLLAGQARGSYATVHAQSVDEGLRRLKTLGVDAENLASIDCLVIQRRMLSYDQRKRKNLESRRVVAIAEIDGDGKARTIYDGKARADHNGMALDLGSSGLLEKVAETFGMDRKEIEAEIKSRMKLIRKAGPDYEGFFRTIQSELFSE